MVSSPPVPVRQHRRKHYQGGGGLRRVEAVVLVTPFVGVLLVAVAFAMGRSHTSGALVLYWLGQLLVVSPAASYAAFVPVVPAKMVTAISVTLAVGSHLIKVCYSPLGLRFLDELQHVRGTLNTLESGHIFTENLSLPIQKDFWGLESIGSVMASATGLSVDVVGLILGGVLKVATVLALVGLVREVTRSARLLVLAVVLYCANPNFTFFTSFYVYETVALPFLLTALWTFARVIRGRGNRLTGAICVVCIVGTLISHHVTAIVLLACLGFMTLWSVALRRWDLAKRGAPLVGFAALVVFGYFALVAHGVYAYLLPFTTLSTSSSVNSIAPLPDVRVSPQSAPIPDIVLSRAGIVLVAIIIGCGVLILLGRSYQRRSFSGANRSQTGLQPMFGVLASLLLLTGVLAVFRPYGQQTAVRGSAFTYIGVAFVGALALFLLLSRARRRRGRIAGVLAVVVALVAYGSGIELFWPPFWERLPGIYAPAGAESGVDIRVETAAEWAGLHTADANFAADANGGIALAGLGKRRVSAGAAPMFYDDTLTPLDQKIIETYSIRYVWTDTRTATTISPSSRYFSGAVGVQYQYPPPLSGLTKFSDLPGARVIYTDGVVTIVDLRGGTR